MKAADIKAGRFYTLRDGTLVRVERRVHQAVFEVYEQDGGPYRVTSRDIVAQTSGPAPEQPS